MCSGVKYLIPEPDNEIFQGNEMDCWMGGGMDWWIILDKISRVKGYFKI